MDILYHKTYKRNNDKYIQIILKKLVLKNLKKYGTTTYFQENDFLSASYKNNFLFFRSRTGNKDYLYDFQLVLFDNIELSKGSKKKCVYCSKKGCDHKLKNSNNYVHFKCGLDKDFIYKEIDRICEPTNKDECSVCFEETDNRTICGHSVCKKCLLNIYQNNELICPYCRRSLIETKKETLTSEYSVEISKNMSVNIKISYAIDNFTYYQNNQNQHFDCISLI